MNAIPVMPKRLERVLCVDDESDIQLIVLWSLEDVGGLTVHTSNSGAQACMIAPAFAPDLIMLDIQMPGMNGWQTIAALRAIPHTATTPIILLSASQQPDQTVFARDSNVIGFIAKPFDPLTLAVQVRYLWSAAYPQDRLNTVKGTFD